MKKDKCMKADINGINTCKNGEERYVFITLRCVVYYQYDYRTPCGRLFSCVKLTLDACREARDKWLKSADIEIKNKI